MKDFLGKILLSKILFGVYKCIVSTPVSYRLSCDIFIIFCARVCVEGHVTVCVTA